MNNKNREHKTGKKKQKERYYFFLNPYIDSAFTRCPKCETNTKLKKYCLLIHIKPRHFISLNKTTRYCPGCDLIIVKKEDLERLLCAIYETRFPEIIGNEYLVMGTMERKDWKKSMQGTMDAKEAMDYVVLFKDIWSFEVKPGGWVYEPDKDKK
jgi:hypothetical protein